MGADHSLGEPCADLQVDRQPLEGGRVRVV
jgi:hypothetical protein